jgi:hypothetical protein
MGQLYVGIGPAWKEFMPSLKLSDLPEEQTDQYRPSPPD